jgi:hypothetical protein
VPQVLVGGGEGSASGNLFSAWLSQMISQNVLKDAQMKAETAE